MSSIETLAILSVFLALISISNSSTCGGNCPDNSCTTCHCGSTPVFMPLDNYCTQSKIWDVNCCKCIAAR